MYAYKDVCKLRVDNLNKFMGITDILLNIANKEDSANDFRACIETISSENKPTP